MTFHSNTQESLNEQHGHSVCSETSSIGEFVVGHPTILGANSKHSENSTVAHGEPQQPAADPDAILDRMYQDYWTL